jgi:hypothetical protein
LNKGAAVSRAQSEKKIKTKSGRKKPVTLVMHYSMVGETGYSSIESMAWWSWRRSALQVWRLAYIYLGTDPTVSEKDMGERQHHFSWFCSKFKDSLDRMLYSWWKERHTMENKPNHGAKTAAEAAMLTAAAPSCWLFCELNVRPCVLSYELLIHSGRFIRVWQYHF